MACKRICPYSVFPRKSVSQGSTFEPGKLWNLQKYMFKNSIYFHILLHIEKKGGTIEIEIYTIEMGMAPALCACVYVFVHRGCLFYGPPGTGKTLVARALANECSQGDKKVAFFMRKGADCLSKWVGESERQLRLLFDQVRITIFYHARELK